ncbi:DUF805 domain-containing protein [Stenotrophomonas rhizophila]|uniref:DUF805 domain-containing protein n=1 Tax=Stenotrophomonas rhizophila TaxID=216778 RepID=UPI001E57321B|nr:DUF805 domain-containing protein [Stenotrophomonas rhizophila]MCC7635414.1 DUF805 domain-containing protein [Stenotrophomonas rhizophila]MCC7664357.1 DUF805 domain-containing protein [Stenotrophomonas rhizophila]
MNNLLLPFRRALDFSGRSDVKEARPLVLVVGWTLIACVGLMIYGVSAEAYRVRTGMTPPIRAGAMIGSAVLVATIWPLTALLVRRLHDGNRSAWFMLLSLIPSVGPLIMVYFMLVEGDKDENRYGAPFARP